MAKSQVINPALIYENNSKVSVATNILMCTAIWPNFFEEERKEKEQVSVLPHQAVAAGEVGLWAGSFRCQLWELAEYKREGGGGLTGRGGGLVRSGLMAGA